MNDEDRIADVLLVWEEAREKGNTGTAEDLCRDCPELLDAVRERIRLLEKAGWMKEPGAPPHPRTLADRYLLETLIGTGGYAEVWRAYDLQLHRHVAVKVPKPNRTLTALQIDETLTEARQIARLKHVNIVTVHDVAKEGMGYFLVTDLIDGETLADRLKRGPMPPVEAAKLVVEVARAIDYAHGQGVVHRDLKPGNIFLDKEGRPHIGDFGLARSAQELIDGSDSRGTLAYCSPEQLEGKPLDGRSDIWSLGIVLYEMIAGRPPFVDDNPVRLKQSILAAQVPDVPGATSALTTICRRCLAAKPEERFATATELADALTHCRAGRRARRFWLFAVPVGITALSVLGGLFLARGPASEPENPNTLHVGTRQAAANWRVTGAGATGAPAYPYGGRQQEISLTDNGGRMGQFITGGSAEKFNGCWVATRRFTLPAEVESISLTFSNLQCDDRGVLMLNGTVVGNYSVMGAGPGRMSLSPDLPDTEFTFTNATSGTIDTGFVLDGENTLTLVVNNVSWDRHQRTRPFSSSSDGTHAGVDATIVFTHSSAR